MDAPVEESFDLLRSIDLHLESMLASDERAVAGVTSGLICGGDEVTWQARHRGVTWRMTSKIVEFDPPRRFVDETARGPFTAFRHEHLFEACGSGTRMTDVRRVGADDRRRRFRSLTGQAPAGNGGTGRPGLHHE